jgi:uncharacterized protein YecE (DUF72 family)
VWNDVTTLEHASEAAFGLWPQTTDFVYLRLMGDLESKYDPVVGERIHHYREIMWPRDAALDNWAEKIRSALQNGQRALVYFANHFEGFAPASAVRLGRKLGLAIELPSNEEMHGQDPRQMALF